MKVKKVGENKYIGDSINNVTHSQKEFSNNEPVVNLKSGNKKIFISIGGILILIIIASLFYFLVIQKNDNNMAEENSQSYIKKKELELKERELQIKEKENEQKNKNSVPTGNTVNNITPGRFPEASEKYLTTDYLLKFSKYDLKIMRNEIFARHGYIFQTDDLKEYFTRQSWYSPGYNDVSSFLTDIEKSNIELIKHYEKN